MRRVRYQVAMSLDGYIAPPGGDVDWIPHDPTIDFVALMAQFDTFLLGRRTYEATGMASTGRKSSRTFVFSRTLKQEDHPRVTIVSSGIRELVSALRAEKGKDIWLFGGGELFRSLLEEGLVDTVEVGVVPVLLGCGTPLLPASQQRTKLQLTRHERYPSGIVGLTYEIVAR